MECVIDARSLKLHEVCEAWPKPSDEDLEKLGQSIRDRGILVPILIHGDRILDGRSRWIAGLNVGYEFKAGDFKEWDDDGSIVGTVFALNNERRHMTLDQKRAVAAELQEAIAREMEESKRRKCSESGKQGGRGNKRVVHDPCTTLSGTESPDKSRKAAAKLMGIGENGVQDAISIRKASPETHQQIKEGRKTIKDAQKELGISKPKRKRPDLPPGRHEIPLDPSKPDGPKKTTYIPHPDSEPDLDGIAQDIAEREAIRDQDSDEEWVKGLEPYRRLEGRLRDDFCYAAITARRFWGDGGRDALRSALGSILKGNRRTPGWAYWFERGLMQAPPDQWVVCPPMNKGGCDGAGRIDLMDEDCKMCRSRGYLMS